MKNITRISISEKVYSYGDVHPAMRRNKQIIIHDGWQWHMGNINNKEELKDFLDFFNIELIEVFQEVEYETTGKITFYNLSKNIINYRYGGFWSIEELRKITNNAELKKVKGLSNGSVVDCYAEIKEDEVIIYRPNPNAKEVYKEMLLEDELNFRRNNWYI